LLTLPQEPVIIFDQIDVDNNKARMIGNAGATNVYILTSPKMITFVETTETGNQIFTSVFIYSPFKDGAFASVTSRHINIVMPVVSQYHGTCVNQSL